MIGSGARRHPGHALAPVGRRWQWLDSVADAAHRAGTWFAEIAHESARISELGPDAEAELGRRTGSRC